MVDSPSDTGGHPLPQLHAIERLIERLHPGVRVQARDRVEVDGHSLPLYSFHLGARAASAPAIGLFGGVHGVERIGTDILVSFLHTLNERLRWEAELHALLEHVHVVVAPLVNPGGMLRGSRSNPRGVDLMRNAPIESDRGTTPLVGGHRLSRRLPWYRGRAGDPMEPEARFLTETVKAELLGRPLSLALDCHSGYGQRDRLWFLHASTAAPFAHLPEVYALKSLFESTYPQHDYYTIEPQAKHYTARGDLWDYLFQEAQREKRGLFLPFTLELGSMLWVRKNWRQGLTYEGYFNPVKPKRHARALRRHQLLLEFLVRAARNYKAWLSAYSDLPDLHHAALQEWYPAGTRAESPHARRWILLRGLAREARHWGNFAEALQARFPDASIHAIDLPGTGKLSDRASPPSVRGILEALRARLDELGIRPPFNLVGISLGGMITLDWVQAHPEEIERAIVINPSAGNLSPFYKRLRPRNYAAIAWHLCLARRVVAREAAVLRMTANRLEPAEHAAVARQWANYARERPIRSGTVLRQLYAARRFRLTGAPPERPVLVLASALDTLVDPDCSIQVARFCGSPLRLHSTAGHDLPLDDPGWVVDRIEEWLHGAEPGPPAPAPDDRERRA